MGATSARRQDGMVEYFILGTAGHIDHGKTALVRALTGVDTDRLPEEKKRGITIDLGFAEIDLGRYRLGVVDVPGHERFVRNMLAGATSMDMVMLIVAADDSVKQQTREHLDILRLLRRQHGLIVLTKCDLVEPEWLDLVESEVRDAALGTFLEEAPLVRTSAKTGQGLEDLREALTAAAEIAAQSEDRRQRQQGPFRLAVDRAFHVAGHGAVVTGSVAGGVARVGDPLVLEPGRLEVRVRGLQNHERDVPSVECGQRAAINLAGVRLDGVQRGHELASPGHLRPAKLLTAELETLPNAPWPIKDRATVRFHAGAAEILTQVRLLNVANKRLEPGERGYAQLFLREPAACVWGQPFVLRSESPVATIGGGRILDPSAVRLREPQELDFQMLSSWADGAAAERVEASAYFAGLSGWDESELPRTAGVADGQGEWTRQLQENGKLLDLHLSPTRRLRVHLAALGTLLQRVAAILARFHDEHPLSTEMPRRQLEGMFDYLPDPLVLQTVLELGKEKGQWLKTSQGWALAGRGPQLSQNERKLLEWLVERFQQSGFESPAVDELQQQAQKNRQSVPQLVDLAVQQGRLVRIGPTYVMSREADEEAQQRLAEQFRQQGALTVSQIREILQTSRKYAVPYCEYLDAVGATVRQGDARTWAR